MDTRPRDLEGRFISPRDVPKYEIVVWDMWSEGDIQEVVYEATERDLERIEEQYGDDPQFEIDVKDTSD